MKPMSAVKVFLSVLLMLAVMAVPSHSNTDADISAAIASFVTGDAEGEAVYAEIIEKTQQYEVGHLLFDSYHLLTKRIRTSFGGWLQKSQEHIEMIREIFREKGLPLELAYLPLIESGFSPYAVSPAKAVGLWQFVEGTARDYSLRIDEHVDERRDPERSTRAAADYLVDLYDIFGSWSLALAAYNAGQNRIIRIIDTHGDIYRSSSTPLETKRYVPLFVIATAIAKAPERFGFVISKAVKKETRQVIVSRATALRTLAHRHKTTAKVLKELNPALLTEKTPPYAYALRIPAAMPLKEGIGTRESAAVASYDWTMRRCRFTFGAPFRDIE
ncbi:MAG: lytic transglycosylase domain-containing protein [Nitrospirota bacterium]